MDCDHATAYAPAMNELAPEDPVADPLSWRPRKAPSLAEFEVIATEAFRRLPAHFRARCDGVVVQVDDYPTDEVLEIGRAHV